MARVGISSPFLAYALALTLVLAGCSGLTGGENGAGSGDDGGRAGTGAVDGGADVSVTPAPVPTIEDTTSSGSRLAPGLTASGVSDPNALLTAHRRALDADPYTVRAVARATYANGTLYYRSAATTRVTKGGSRYYYVGRFALANAGESALSRYESWSDGRTILTASVTKENASGENTTSRGAIADENATYERIPAEYERNAGLYGSPRYGERIYGQLSGAETVVRDRTDAVGPTYYVVAITAVRSRGGPPGGRFSNVRNVSGRFLVSPEGFVKEYRFAFTGTTPAGETVRVVESIRYSSVGWTTVPRPPWYDAAIAATNETAAGANET